MDDYVNHRRHGINYMRRESGRNRSEGPRNGSLYRVGGRIFEGATGSTFFPLPCLQCATWRQYSRHLNG